MSASRRVGLASALGLALSAAPAFADDLPVGGLRLATCAALWEGYADVLGDDGERALAAQFRDAAARVLGEAEADAQIAERRAWMVDLLTAYIHDQDDQSRRLFERLVRGCGDLAGDLSLTEPRD